MARMIDLDVALNRYYVEYERQDICDGSQDRDWLMRCLEEAPTLTLPNEWVSVEDRLPENDADVLMWRGKWKIAEAGTYRNARFWVYDEIGDSYVADDITHWMHLPAPPDSHPQKKPNEPLTCNGCMYDGKDFMVCYGCARKIADYYRRPPEGEVDGE